MSTPNTELRERAIYPILIPLGAVVIVEIVVFAMSRVLLVSGKTPATLIALAAAVGIMIGASFVAARPRMSSRAIAGLLVLTGIVTVGSGAWALTQKPFYEREAEANRPEVAVSAANLAFDTDELHLAAGGTVIEFDNADSQPHNIAIYPSEEELNESLFKGEIIDGGASTTYEVGAIEAGTYYFHCDVHPTMQGEAVVEEGAAHGAEEGAGH